MNFISHYYFDGRPQRPYYNLGIILPDLARGLQKVNRIRPALLAPKLESPNQVSLNEGCARHFMADKVFHNSEFFAKHTAALKEMMKQIDLDQSFTRYSFLSHIMLELMIDRILIKKDPVIAQDFYDSLDEVENQEVAGYLEQSRLYDHSGFFKFFDNFRGVRYLFHYTDNEKMVYSLSRVIQRAGLEEPSVDNKRKLELLVEEVETYLTPEYPILFDELKRKLSEH